MFGTWIQKNTVYYQNLKNIFFLASNCIERNGRQKEPSDKTLPSIHTQFSRHDVLNGGALRSALSCYQNGEIKILNNKFPQIVGQSTNFYRTFLGAWL